MIEKAVLPVCFKQSDEAVLQNFISWNFSIRFLEDTEVVVLLFLVCYWDAL